MSCPSRGPGCSNHHHRRHHRTHPAPPATALTTGEALPSQGVIPFEALPLPRRQDRGQDRSYGSLLNHGKSSVASALQRHKDPLPPALPRGNSVGAGAALGTQAAGGGAALGTQAAGGGGFLEMPGALPYSWLSLPSPHPSPSPSRCSEVSPPLAPLGPTAWTTISCPPSCQRKQ